MSTVGNSAWAIVLRFRTRFPASLSVRSLFSASRGLLVLLSMIFAGRYHVKSCLRATSLLNEFFRKSSKFRKTLSITGCRHIHSLGSWLVVPGNHRGSSSGIRIPPMLCIHLETRMPLHRTAILKTSPFGSFCNFTTKPNIFTKKMKTFVAPARELGFFRQLKPFLTLVMTKARLAFCGKCHLKCLFLQFGKDSFHTVFLLKNDFFFRSV